MADNVNINVTENIDQVNIVASEVVEVVDLNLYATTEDVTINVTEEIIQVNINKVEASNITKTSDLINDGEDGINPFITLNDIPPVEGFVPYTGATQNVDLGEFELKAGQVTLDTSPTGTAAVATTRWNNTAGITETTLKGGSVVLKNGVDLVARVVNKVTPNTTLTKANYAAVRISGAQGQRLAVAYAQANNDLNSADTIGLVCETIPTNQEGFILTVGQLENINTTGSLQGETWNDGDVIYLSPTVAGKLTNIKPTAPQHIVIIGYVEYAHANNGKLYVKIMNGWELEELHNVSSTNYTTPIDTDSVLTYDVTNSLWKRLSWSNIKSNLKTYFDTIYQAALGFTPENVANKATNLTSPDNTKYPTTQAVVDGLATKQDTLTNPITGTGANGQVAFFNGTTTQTGDNGLFWDNTNKRLGIGTINPTSPLTVNGTAFASRFLCNENGTSAGLAFGRLSNGFWFPNGNTIATLVNNAERMRITDTGQVTIGATTAGARLDVRAQGALSTDIAFRVRNSADTADLMTVNGLGNLGIGKSIPTARLDVFSDIEVVARLKNSNAFSSSMVLESNNGNTAYIYQRNGANALGGFTGVNGFSVDIFGGANSISVFKNNGDVAIGGTITSSSTYTGSKMLILGGTGNVLINTTTDIPSSKLTIASTTQGFLPPRMTTTQRNAIATPAAGLIVYDTTDNKHYGYNGTTWYIMDADIVTTNRQSASYTLTLTDRSKLVEMDVATANNLTIPLNSSVAFPIGTKIDVAQYGAGQTTFVATVGVTIRSANNWLKINARYGAATLTKIGTDEWYLWGNLNA